MVCLWWKMMCSTYGVGSDTHLDRVLDRLGRLGLPTLSVRQISRVYLGSLVVGFNRTFSYIPRDWSTWLGHPVQSISIPITEQLSVKGPLRLYSQ